MATSNPLVVSAKQYHLIFGSNGDGSEVGISPHEMLDSQVHTLRIKGFDCSDKDVNQLHAFAPKKSLRFLVVPPEPSTLDLDGLMALIDVDGKKGTNYLDPQLLTSVVKTPATAHLLLDVEDGRKRLKTKPSVSSDNIRREGRLAYTVWYGLIHGIVFPCMLQHYHLDLCGSSYKSVCMPSLCLYEGIPRLYSRLSDKASLKWGAPSAGSAID